MAYKPMTDEEYEAGLERGRQRLETATIATAVSYDAGQDMITIVLPNACLVIIPRQRISEFAGLSTAEMQEIRLSAIGDAIAVGSHDVHVDLGGMLEDVFPERLLGRRFAALGGKATSAAKARAARENGARGGRPRKAIGIEG
jgi:hypothetical protein